MPPRIYSNQHESSTARELAKLREEIREIKPYVKTLAEEKKRAQIIRTARQLARNERRKRHPDRSRR